MQTFDKYAWTLHATVSQSAYKFSFVDTKTRCAGFSARQITETTSTGNRLDVGKKFATKQREHKYWRVNWKVDQFPFVLFDDQNDVERFYIGDRVAKRNVVEHEPNLQPRIG